MKLKKIRNALLVVLTLALVSATAVAVTWAYVNKTLGSQTNTFTNTEEIDVGISEPNWKGEPTYASPYSPGDSVDQSITKDVNDGKTLANKYFAGLSIPKDPRLTNISYPTTTNQSQKDSSTEIVGVKLSYIVKDDSSNSYEYPSYADFRDSIAKVAFGSTPTDGYNSNWIAFDTNQLYLYHKAPIAWHAQTSNIFDYVVINTVSSITDYNNIPSDAKGIYTNGTNYSVRVYDPTLNSGDGGYKRITTNSLPDFDIKIKGYAVQSNPISSSLTDISGSGDTNKAARNALRSLMGLAAES